MHVLLYVLPYIYLCISIYANCVYVCGHVLVPVAKSTLTVGSYLSFCFDFFEYSAFSVFFSIFFLHLFEGRF